MTFLSSSHFQFEKVFMTFRSFFSFGIIHGVNLLTLYRDKVSTSDNVTGIFWLTWRHVSVAAGVASAHRSVNRPPCGLDRRVNGRFSGFSKEDQHPCRGLGIGPASLPGPRRRTRVLAWPPGSCLHLQLPLGLPPPSCRASFSKCCLSLLLRSVAHLAPHPDSPLCPSTPCVPASTQMSLPQKVMWSYASLNFYFMSQHNYNCYK